MSVSVIGAGFGRTGTESMKQALEILGLGPCHHMLQVLQIPDQMGIWRGITTGSEPNWGYAFAGFGSTVDCPSAAYWRETAAHFLDAKVLLTVRDAEKSYDSINNTIFEIIRMNDDAASLAISLIRDRVFGGDIEDCDHVIAIYEKNVADVMEAFAPDRLLAYELGSGWEPLCNFLDLPLPVEALLRVNSTTEFR